MSHTGKVVCGGGGEPSRPRRGVTGGAQGFGWAIAQSLAANGALV